MNDNRPTIRPVNLSRLVEVTHLCTTDHTSAEIETTLGVTPRRAREAILETCRINLIEEYEENSEVPVYRTTDDGNRFVEAIMREDWDSVSDVLQANSPHYHHFLEVIETIGPTNPDAALKHLQESAEGAHTYNQTSLDVLSSWAERLGIIQRNAFTGNIYPVLTDTVPSEFPDLLLAIFDDLETKAGVNLRQRYLPIPELREHLCEREGLPRELFDRALNELVENNVGRLELSGAPIDTGAKDAVLGIKTIERADTDGIVSTDQSADLSMRGIEQHGKLYYYLAVHDRNLEFITNHD